MAAIATLQAKMKATLERAGIPALEIKCMGSHILITTKSLAAAEKFRSLLLKFCSSVQPVVESIEYHKENKQGVLNPSSYKVWLVGGRI